MVELITGEGFSSNGYLINRIAIDAPLIKKQIDAELLIITHPHCDHFLGSESYKCKKASSEFAKELINSKSEGCLCSYMGFEFPKIKIDLCLKDGEIITANCKNNATVCNCQSTEDKTNGSNCKTFVDCYKRNNLELEVIYTPGHCEGSICLYEPNKKILFSGDTVFPEYNFPRTDLPSSNIDELKKSYGKLKELEIETIYPGHGPVIKEKKYLEKLLKMF